MTPSSGPKRARYGTRRLIEQVFNDPSNSSGLKTSDLVQKVQSASGAGSKIPGPTIFQAARALIKRKVLEAKRDGREFRFKLVVKQELGASPGLPESSAPTARSTPLRPEPIAAPALRVDEVLPTASLPVSSLPHRLDPGQMLVLRHDQDEIVTLTNVHGKPVIEKLRI